MAAPKDDLLPRLARVKLLALDVDGVLTDGRVIYTGDEEEEQTFHVRDGQGLSWLRKAGVELVWITGRGCAATEKRAAELGVREVHTQAGPKAKVLADVQARLGISPAETICMGDDLPDLAMRGGSALFCAPADAHPIVREEAGLVTKTLAADGAVREVCEAVLRAKGLWKGIVERYLGESC